MQGRRILLVATALAPSGRDDASYNVTPRKFRPLYAGGDGAAHRPCHAN